MQSQLGLGVVLGARVLAEFGDDPHRYATAKGRKAFAGTAPITRASRLRQVVLARSVGNRRLTTACHLWAFAALTGSPGARCYYDALRPARPPTIRRCEPWATGWSGSCTSAWVTADPTTSNSPGPRPPPPRPPDSSEEEHRGRGSPSPGVLARSLARGPVVQVERWCREVKRDGTAGLQALIALDRGHGRDASSTHSARNHQQARSAGTNRRSAWSNKHASRRSSPRW